MFTKVKFWIPTVIFISMNLFFDCCAQITKEQTYIETFEDSSDVVKNWKFIFGPASKIELSDSISFDGQKSLHYVFNKDTIVKTKRAEVTRLARKRTQFEFGQEYSYTIHYFIPDSWEFETNNMAPEIITQWHHEKSGKHGGSPPLALAIRGSNWEIWNHYGDPFVRNEEGKVYYEKERSNLNVLVDSIAVDKGKWIEWKIDVLWHHNKGRISIWKDKELIAEYKKQGNCYKDTDVYMKLGIYKSGWFYKKARASRVYQRELYIDGIEVKKI